MGKWRMIGMALSVALAGMTNNGCATIDGIVKDTTTSYEVTKDWTKDKVNQGATYIKNQTEK